MNASSSKKPCRPGCVSLLMQMGGDGATCTANDEGYSALALASSLGHREVVRVMIEAGWRQKVDDELVRVLYHP